MNWEINIPYRSRDDPVSEIGFAARDLPEDERPVVQRLALDAITSGTETVGDFLDELEGLSEPERRQRLDEARIACGMESATELEQRREDAIFEDAWQRLQPPPPPEWDEMQRCPVCGIYPTKAGGAWAPTKLERWHCPEHEHLAEEGDMDEHVAPYFPGVNGRLIPSPREKARLEAWHREREESEERERELREEHLEAEAAALDAVRESYGSEAWVSVAGVQVHPANLRINP